MTAINEISAERRRQIESEGWDAEHDSQHINGELATAAACYATGDPTKWVWDWKWWKPKHNRRNLVRAGALIVAEIERLDRLEISAQTSAAGVTARETAPLFGIFRDHSCWKCKDGAQPCVAGNPNQCEYPHARND